MALSEIVPMLLIVLSVHAATPSGETFVLLDGAGKFTIDNADRARQRFTPCSTFKIPNSVIGLDTAVIPDEWFELQYDPKRDGPQHGAWSRDFDLRSGLRESAVWYFRELARRVGSQRMQVYMDRLDYGNRDMSGGIDQFWIGGGLRISAEEQVRFLARLRENRLAISPRAGSIVRDLLLLEAGHGYRWFGKTGTCTDPVAGPVAWHVGFVERSNVVTYYAHNFSGTTVGELFTARPKLIRARLSKIGLIDAQAPSPRTQMEIRVREAIGAFPGTVSLFAKNLDTGEVLEILADERVGTASTIKLPIMAAAFSAVAKGKLSWDDTVDLQEDDKISGSGVLTEFSAGTRLKLRDLVNLMIVVSDNTATNLVLDRVGADFVNAESRKLGLTQTLVLRKVMGKSGVGVGHSVEGLREEFRRFGLGVSTPREMGALIEKLANGKVVSRDASGEMLRILARQQFKDGIGRRLPGSDVASKSGSLDRLRSDVGLVRFVGGRLAIAVTVDDMLRTDYSPENHGQVLISELTGMLTAGLSVPLANLGTPKETIELKAEMDHVQGIEIDGDRLWVTWVDRVKHTGHLGVFDLATGKLLRSVPVQDGARYHPGGVAAHGESLWLPVAEYRAGSSSVIQRRNKRTLQLEAEWEVSDHIGCVAVAGDRVHGGNWDARQLYVWDRSGKLIGKRDNPSGTRYQDMKAKGLHLIASGPRGSEGAIDWLDPHDFRLLRRIRTGKSDRGVILTHEGMAISKGLLYLLPEDSPSRLFVFEVTGL